MKERGDMSKSHQTSGRIDEFERRAQRIRDRLDMADEILGNIQVEKKKTNKATDVFQGIFVPIERGLKKLFVSSFSHVGRSTSGQGRRRYLVPRKLAGYLRSCSDEQLAEIRSEIDRILRERGST